MASAIAYLSRKAAHTQVNPTVPLTTLGNTDAPSFEALQGTRAELVQDIVLFLAEGSCVVQKAFETEEIPHRGHSIIENNIHAPGV